MNRSQFVYVTYIRTTPEKLWAALTTPEIMKDYWFGAVIETNWKAGSAWRMVHPDGRVSDGGEILEAVPGSLIVMKWRNEWRPELNAEGFAQCRIVLEPVGKVVKLTIEHSIERSPSKLIEAVSGGWPKILSNLKSLLETGSVVLTEK
jgi:uncharacterized protein YndB with AHSA1/START domain